MLDQWYKSAENQSLLYNTKDPTLRGQCVQSFCFWAQIMNWPIIWADAYKWWGAVGYDSLSINQAQPGDGVIWDASLPNTGGAGHIAIFYAWLPGKQQFISIDQNWGGKYVHKVTHDLSYVKGVIRGKQVGGKGAAEQPGEAAMLEEDAKNCYRTVLFREPENDQVWRPYQGQRFTAFANAARQSQEWLTYNHIIKVGYPTLIQQLQATQAQLQQLAENEALAKQQRDDVQAQLNANRKALEACNVNQAQATENNGLLKWIASKLGMK